MVGAVRRESNNGLTANAVVGVSRMKNQQNKRGYMQQLRKIHVEEVNIKTATISVKALTINNRKLTMAVFRQIEKEDIFKYYIDSCLLKGEPWGRVNYFWDNDTGITHLVWQKNDELRRCIVRYYEYNRAQAFDIEAVRYLKWLKNQESAIQISPLYVSFKLSDAAEWNTYFTSSFWEMFQNPKQIKIKEKPIKPRKPELYLSKESFIALNDYLPEDEKLKDQELYFSCRVASKLLNKNLYPDGYSEPYQDEHEQWFERWQEPTEEVLGIIKSIKEYKRTWRSKYAQELLKYRKEMKERKHAVEMAKNELKKYLEEELEYYLERERQHKQIKQQQEALVKDILELPQFFIAT